MTGKIELKCNYEARNCFFCGETLIYRKAGYNCSKEDVQRIIKDHGSFEWGRYIIGRATVCKSCADDIASLNDEEEH